MALNDQELRQVISNAQSALGNFTNVVESSNQILARTNELGKTEEELYAEHLENLGKWNKQEDKQRIQYLKQLNKELESQNKAKAAIEAQRMKVLAAESQLNAQIQSERAALQALGGQNAAQAAKLNKSIAKLTAQQQKTSDLHSDLNRALAENATHAQALAAKIGEQEKELSKFSFKDASKKAGDQLKDGIKKLFSGASLISAVKEATEVYRKGLSTAGDNMLFSLGKQIDAAKLGLTPKEYIEMNAASRQTILAAGGASEQLKILNAQSAQLGEKFGTVGERTKFAQGQMDALALAGIKPTMQNAGLLNKSFDAMRKMSGMTTEQFNAMSHELATDSDIQIQLRAANMDERKQIMLGIHKRIEENRALGMTVEQAKAVSKTLAKLSGQGPVDRIKQAAKLRAMGSAMGISGSDDAANIMIKGQRASDEEKKKLQDYLTRASNAMSESQTGSLQGEIFASTLTDKLGLTQLVGPGSEFNTRQAEALEVDKKGLAEQGKSNELLDKINTVVGQIQAGLANPLVQGAGAIAGGILGSKLWKGAVTGAAGGGGLAGGAAGAAGAGKNLLKGVGKGAGLAAIAAAGGYAIDAGFGAMGFGKQKIDEAQDDANWERATLWEKTQSGVARSLEKVGEFLFLDNMVNEAKAERIANETAYLNAKTPNNPLEQQVTKLDASNQHLSQMTKLLEQNNKLMEAQLAQMSEKPDNKSSTPWGGQGMHGTP
jgi:hypothetical protein